MLLEIKDGPNAYRPSKPKRILVLQCDSCGGKFERQYTQSYMNDHKWGQFCSRKCYGSFRSRHPELYADNTAMMHTPAAAQKISESVVERMKQPGYVHPWQGRQHSDETKQKMSANHADVSGPNNGMYGRKHRDSSKDAMSDKHSLLLLVGKQRPYGGNSKKGDHRSNKTGREHFYKSGWELSLMRWLDMAPFVVDWDYECVRIPYVYDRHKRWYVPDFMVTFVDGHRELWEVKPVEFIGSEKNVLKSEATRAWCVENNVTRYRTLTGDDLRALLII